MLQVGICSSVAAFILLCAPGAQAACPDYITAPTGLQYCDIKVGSGDAPTSGAFIKVHYDGRLDSDVASGKFDSSYERGRPLAFAVGTGQVIKGWDQGILGGDGVEPMKAGGKRKLVIPPELGYGARGAGGVIPPNATLYFDVEYLGKR
jgi:peptidylprolyl isomerase